MTLIEAFEKGLELTVGGVNLFMSRLYGMDLACALGCIHTGRFGFEHMASYNKIREEYPVLNMQLSSVLIPKFHEYFPRDEVQDRDLLSWIVFLNDTPVYRLSRGATLEWVKWLYQEGHIYDPVEVGAALAGPNEVGTEFAIDTEDVVSA